MLAGLLFAMEEARGEPARLVATLPFAGTTLIEHQARQLVAAGAGQIVVIGDPAAPALAGALHRLSRRRVAVDAVAGAADAASLIHPLARVAMLADGLVAADATVAAMAGEGGDALLVTASAEAPAGFERIGGGAAWAGLARFGAQRLADVATLPVDYDPQSALLRAIESAGAARVALTGRALTGHVIERDAATLEREGRRALARAVASRHGWFDRLIAAPLVRAAMPWLAANGVSAVMATSLAAGAAVLGAAALLAGWCRTGLVVELLATVGAVLAATLATVAEDRRLATAAAAITLAAPIGAMLLLGRWAAAWHGDAVPLVLAVVLAMAALLGERAMRERRWWWGSPPAHALVVTLLAIPGWPVAGLGVAACYAGATLAAAIEQARVEDAPAEA